MKPSKQKSLITKTFIFAQCLTIVVAINDAAAKGAALRVWPLSDSEINVYIVEDLCNPFAVCDRNVAYDIYREGKLISHNPGVDANLTPNTRYCYSLIAYSSSGGKVLSQPACATTSWVSESVVNNVYGDPVPILKIHKDGSPRLAYGTLNTAVKRNGSWIVENIGAGECYAEDLAINANDKPSVICRDPSDNSLWQASLDGNLWTSQKLCDNAIQPSAIFDALGNLHISFQQTGVYTHTYGKKNRSSNWQSDTIDKPGSGCNSSIGVDRSGKVHISASDFAQKTIKYVTNASGSWVVNVVAGPFTSDNVPASSLAVDISGKIHICYLDPDSKQLIYCSNTSGSWILSAIMQADGGPPSIVVGRDMAVHICFVGNSSNNGLKYVTNKSGSWVKVDIQNFGQSPSLSLDSFGNLHIAYAQNAYYYPIAYQDLRYIMRPSNDPNYPPEPPERKVSAMPWLFLLFD